MVIEPAPEPQEIYWENLYISRMERTYRRVIIEVRAKGMAGEVS
jgi:hypothetical protein